MSNDFAHAASKSFGILLVAFFWFVQGAAFGMLPLLGPYFAARMFMRANVARKPPIVVASMVATSATFSQYWSARTLSSQLFENVDWYAFMQILVFALTCMEIWLAYFRQPQKSVARVQA